MTLLVRREGSAKANTELVLVEGEEGRLRKEGLQVCTMEQKPSLEAVRRWAGSEQGTVRWVKSSSAEVAALEQPEQRAVQEWTRRRSDTTQAKKEQKRLARQTRRQANGAWKESIDKTAAALLQQKQEAEQQASRMLPCNASPIRRWMAGPAKGVRNSSVTGEGIRRFRDNAHMTARELRRKQYRPRLVTGPAGKYRAATRSSLNIAMLAAIPVL